MIVIKSINLFGRTNEGDFSSKINFSSGVNIITGQNGFGKSLITKSIIWGLGVEQIDIQSHDNSSFMPDSIREKFELSDNSFAKVSESNVLISLSNQDGETLELTRNIVGGDTSKIRCEFQGKSFILTSNSSKNFNDSNTNITRFLMKWAGLVPENVITREGRKTWLYLENLASLFYVNQMGGWGDLFASQIKYYGTLEVNECSFEYTLGLNAHLKKRQETLQGGIESRNQRKLVVERIEAINEFIEKYNEDYVIKYRSKSLDEIKVELKDFNLIKYLKDKGGFNLENEVLREKKRLSDLISEVDNEELKKESLAEESEMSKRMEEIFLKKNEQQEIEARLHDVIFSIAGKEKALESLESKIVSAIHLKDFKHDSIGFFSESLTCPTCTQNVSFDTYDFQDLNDEDVSRNISSFKKEKQILQKSLVKEQKNYQLLKKQERIILNDLADLNLKIQPYKKSVSYSKDKIISLANDISSQNVIIKKASDTILKAVELSSRLNDVLEGVSIVDMQSELENKILAEKTVLNSFQENYRSMLKEIELTVFQGNKELANEVYLDDAYIPSFRGQHLKKFASASDQSRIIFPYLLSCLKTSLDNNGNHIGFSIFDEPLQQNPDEEGRERLITFLSKLPSLCSGQVLTFTSLSENEVKALDELEGLLEISEKRFLRIGTFEI